MIRLIFLLLALNVTTSTHALENMGIEVMGKSSVLAQPDLFSLTVEIKERGKSASKTKAIIDSKSQSIVRAMIKKGIKENAIESSQMRIYPIYEKPSITFEQTELKTRINNQNKITHSGKNEAKDEERELVRFDVSRTFTISFSQLEIYDEVLDVIVKLGITHVSPLDMSFSDPHKHYKQALLQAIEDAKAKAENMAKHSGVTLGRLVSLKESSYYSPARYSMAPEMKGSFDSQVTDKAISAQVIAIYGIE